MSMTGHLLRWLVLSSRLPLHIWLINSAMAIPPNAPLGQNLTGPHLRWLVYRISNFRDPSDAPLWTFGHSIFIISTPAWMLCGPWQGPSSGVDAMDACSGDLSVRLWHWCSPCEDGVSNICTQATEEDLQERLWDSCFRQFGVPTLVVRSSNYGFYPSCPCGVGNISLCHLIPNPINSSHCLGLCAWRDRNHNYQPNTFSLQGIVIPIVEVRHAT